ncbi:muscle-derived protein (neurite-outgrowth-promoting) [Colletotrichum karsti]|uniref:Muscle-derived protein (Neurite-outgrowth-promoting) n=1 Tax=Colletotrichum karsti TaxID=1095194 RepID=A0A9P6ICX9_9PEZI|nr:muscle-derived protein (neurite-outgrowth-promoting) [Colletotrichum karsti]KAF9881112.1 muscle-derived protein (neurite-outgrowth-promoting) [Colletotrichum karsti]
MRRPDLRDDDSDEAASNDNTIAPLLRAETDAAMSTGQDAHGHAPAASVKKGKQKKAVDSNESAKLLAQRISQLEQDAAGEKDQEAEIEREVKRATREMTQQVAKMNDLQKIEHLTKRSSELLAEMRRVERENQKNKKRGDTLQKEKDANRTELSKTIGLKEKLEKLCRELQRDNNKYKNENKTLQDNLKHNSTAYDEKYAALLSKLEFLQEEKDHPRKQVVDMSVDTLFRNRFKSFIEQYELRELHFHSLMRTKELEVQYNMARYEREKKAAETEASRARNLQAQVQTFTKTESELRNQLNVYVDKFKQVEDTLNNSNDLFLTFRKEMEDMSKKTKRLEKENETMKRKHDVTNANIIRMAEEREDWRKKATEAAKRTDKLRSIIEQMQQQGRKVPPGMVATLESCYSDSNGHMEDGDGSDYSDDEEGEEDPSEFDDDDTEEEPQPTEPQPPRPFGPERPPVPQATTNGH